MHQFKIVLDGVRPPIWRHIRPPSGATLWDLHCAINDAMGWEDADLHEFQIGSKRNGERIGISMEDDMFDSDDSERADWDVPLTEHFAKPRSTCRYLYDFGDDWRSRLPARRLRRRPGLRAPVRDHRRPGRGGR